MVRDPYDENDDLEGVVDGDAMDGFDEPADDEAGLEAVDEQGRRRIHRAAPAGTEEMVESEKLRTALPGKFEEWRKRSAVGAVMTGFAFGLKEALEPDRKEPAIVMETSGEPPKDLPVEAELQQFGPKGSVVKVRPWLLEGQEQNALNSPVGQDVRTGQDENE